MYRLQSVIIVIKLRDCSAVSTFSTYGNILLCLNNLQVFRFQQQIEYAFERVSKHTVWPQSHIRIIHAWLTLTILSETSFHKEKQCKSWLKIYRSSVRASTHLVSFIRQGFTILPFWTNLLSVNGTCDAGAKGQTYIQENDFIHVRHTESFEVNYLITFS